MKVLREANVVFALRLRLDVVKGLGDVALIRGRLDRATELTTRLFALLVDGNLVRFARPSVAKTFQFAGEVARQRLATENRATIRTAQANGAAYWYGRAAAEYRDQGLILGSLMTSFMRAELDGLIGDIRNAYHRHLDLVDQAIAIKSEYMRFNFYVGVVKAAASKTLRKSVTAADCAEVLRREVESDHLAPIQTLWGRIAVALWDRAGREHWAALASRAHDLGLSLELVQAIASGTPGGWVFGHY